LIAVAPTVVAQGGSEGSLTGKNVFAAGNYQIGGGLANQSASLYDGVPLQDMAYGNIVVLTPSPEAVEEFRVQTNNSSAEFGRFTGGVVNMASRSGSDVFHGSIFEYDRHTALNSNTFFGKRAGLDKQQCGIVDAGTTVYNGDCGVMPNRLQFPGNIVPANRISPSAAK